ncbi:MAG: aminomethyl-transferring glycine dehydrogenase subunit GcvPA [bacterium]|nr:aminomethyl-transferring glycine dehydrogenase subunit GcvPA [bacterium]
MRYLPLSPDDRRAMLAKVGVDHVDALFADVPNDKLLDKLPDLPLAASELEVERQLSQMAARNLSAGQSKGFFVGAGAYRHHTPATVDHLIQRSEFLTSYTPYQPEISQGTLHVLFEFQTQICMLTGMDVANASMYDGSTATAEAVLMARRVTRRKKAILSGGLHPQYRAVVENMQRFSGGDLVQMTPAIAEAEDLISQIDDQTACVVVQYPDFFGQISDYSELAEAAHVKKALLIIVVTEIVSLGAIKSPGSMGADIVVAEGQSLGCGLDFGGPYVGLFATRQKYIRQMPGRLCGKTVDVDGQQGFVLTLSTREQHIRREKATSNICTNSGLMALAFSIHLTLLGEKGLRQLAMINHANAVQLADELGKINGVDVLNDSFFNEFTIRVPGSAHDLVEALAAKQLLAGVPVSRLHGDGTLEDLLVIAVTEMNSAEQITDLAAAIEGEIS